MFKSPQVASNLLMVSSGHLSWTGNLLSRRQTRIIFLSPPFGDCHVQLRADSRYGDDNPTQWAQPYVPYHCHMAAIPRPNTLLNHQIIWWTPTIGDCSSPPLSGPVSGLWKLRQQIYTELRTSVLFLIDHVTKYQQSISAQRHSTILQPSVKWIQQVLTLSTCPFVISNLLSETCR